MAHPWFSDTQSEHYIDAQRVLTRQEPPDLLEEFFEDSSLKFFKYKNTNKSMFES